MRSISSTTSGRQRRQATRGSCAPVDSGVGDRWETVTAEPFCFPDISPFRKCQNFQSSDCRASSPPETKLKRRASYECLRSDSLPSFTPQFVSKGSRRLQLPPFDSLGIGGSSTDDIISPISPEAGFPRQCLSFDSKLAAVKTRLSASPLSKLSFSPKHHRSSTLPPTPPADDASDDWDIRSGDILRSDNSTISELSSDKDQKQTSGKDPPIDAMSQPDLPSGAQSAGPKAADQIEKSNGDDVINCDGSDSSSLWLQQGVEAAVSTLLVSNARGEAVKVVSQTLPSPAMDPSASASSSGHVTAFTSVIQGIQSRLQPGQSPYINITHAVPQKFSLQSLPSSPPSTPNLLPAGDDYFNLTVFSSATPAVAYHDFRGLVASAVSAFPSPIVPPYSVHVSVLERYLPPSSPKEYDDFFAHNGPSALIDRLVELSPNGGSLILIYPTKQGAQSFKTNYLGPVLDPHLRQMVVVNELSADMGQKLGRMAAVSQMENYDTMKSKIIQLCQKLSHRSDTASHGTQYQLIHADKGEVHLDRNLWAEWYIQQETQRARDTLAEYWRTGNRLPSTDTTNSSNYDSMNREVTAAMLLREILEGVRKRTPSEGFDTKRGVELGIFVIRRS